MRYEELSLPLAGGHFQLRFHPRLTVLAGVGAPERSDIVNAIATATVGEASGGQLVYADHTGRRVVLRDGTATYLDDGTNAPMASGRDRTDAARLKSLLVPHPSELGLPVRLDDEAREVLEQEHEAALAAVSAARLELLAGEAAHERRKALLDELERVEADLAAHGGVTALEHHRYRAALVELERVRATIDAVTSSPTTLANDERLLAAAVEAHALGEEWATAVDRLDQALLHFRDRRRMPPARLELLCDVPESPPPNLAEVMTDYERAVVKRDQLSEELHEAEELGTSAADDVRVVALATLDQDTLWFTHRRVLLAAEQLEVARLAAAARGEHDPAVLARVEEAHAEAAAAKARAERLWGPGVLVVGLAACLSLLLTVAALGKVAVPGLLAVAAVAAFVLIWRPRSAARRAAAQAQAALADADAEDLDSLRRAHLSDGPNSAAWRRADEVVEEYQSSLESWHDLVGNLSVAEVGELEDEVHRFLEASNPQQQAVRIERLRRSLDNADHDLDLAKATLERLLAPYALSLRDLPTAIGAAIHERIRDGVSARLQLELEDAEDAEQKIATRLEELVASLGFRDGELEPRIGALGWAIDEARQRHARRSSAPPLSELEARRAELEKIVQGGSRAQDEAPVAAGAEPRLADAEAVRRAQSRREEIRGELALVVPPELASLGLDVDKWQRRADAIRRQLDSPCPPMADDAGERMFATLSGLRPGWVHDDDPLPAILDEPFEAVPARERWALLDLLLQATPSTQVVVLTSDPGVAAWARTQADRGVLTLLEPSPEREPVLDV